MKFANNRVNYMNPIVVGLIMVVLGMVFSLAQFKVIMNMGQIVESVNMAEILVPWLMSIFTIFGIFLSIPSGTLVQKFGSKRVMLTAVAILIVGTAIGSFADNGLVLLISRAIEGIGYSIMIVAGPAMVVTHTQPDKVGISMGIWVCWVSIGQIIAFNLTPALFNMMNNNWHYIWIIYAVISMIAMLIVKFTVTAPISTALTDSHEKAETSSLKDVLLKKDLLFVSIGYCGFNCLMLGLLTYMAAAAQQTAGMSASQAAFVASIPMIGCFISGPAFGRISLKSGCKKLIILGLAGSSVGYILAFSTSIPLIYVGAVLFGLLGLGIPGMVFSSVAELVGNPKLIGIGTGVIVTFQALGMFLASTFFPNFVELGGGNFIGALIYAGLVATISITLVMLAKFR